MQRINAIVEWCKKHKWLMLGCAGSLWLLKIISEGGEEKTESASDEAEMLITSESRCTHEVEELRISCSRRPHKGEEHVRNLPEGWSASSTKVSQAEYHGYQLEKGQTWVKEYRTGND